MRISDWSSDVCSSDLDDRATSNSGTIISSGSIGDFSQPTKPKPQTAATRLVTIGVTMPTTLRMYNARARIHAPSVTAKIRSEEHTSELQSLMRNSYAVFCLKEEQPPTNHIAHQLKTAGNQT